MNTSLREGSARIYQFPAGGRAALGGRRYGETRPAPAYDAPQVDLADFSDSWYHAAAIQEARNERDH